MVQQLDGSPIIESVAAATSLPLERGRNTPMSIAGRSDVSGTVEWRAVTPGYFRTLGIALRAGRAFEDTDLAASPPAAIVNEAFARRYVGGENPIGERIEVGRIQGKWINASLEGLRVEIIGIAADIREVSLRSEPRRTMYVPQAQAPTVLSNVRRTMPVFIARSRLPGGDVERTLTDAIRAADPRLPRPDVFPLGDLVAAFLWGVTPTDPATLATTAAVLLAVALAASWIPAREAAGVDPVDTLNCE